MPLLLLIAGGLGALGCLIGGLWALRRKRLIDDIPTSKTQGVFIGLVELKGTAESETPLTSYLAGTRCVQYRWHVDEHWSRTVTETYTDAKGHVQTRTRTESGWTTVASGGESISFYLKDDEGIIRVVPDGATVNDVKTFDETCSPGNPLYYGKGPDGAIANSTHRRRFHETALPLHVSLYIMGQARERQDVVAAEIAHDKDAPMFLISTRTERQISGGYGRWSAVWLFIGLVAVAGGAVASDMVGSVQPGLNWQTLVMAGGAFLFALLLGWYWMVHNSLVNLHHMVEQASSQVDVQLKRRHDLIPNLVKTVEEYRTYESETQKLLVEIRSQAEATGGAAGGLKGVTPMLQMVVERYPDLKASGPFLGLQQALVDTEQRIALARDYFNNIATFYNTRLTIIPDRLVANLARLRPQVLFRAADFERAPIEVKLASE